MSAGGAEPGGSNAWFVDHARLLIESHRRLTGRDLLPAELAGDEAARALYAAPFAVLSHDAADDPRFTYANLTAQRLFEMPWNEIVGLPSRLSAQAAARDERQRLLERVTRDGYIADYAGVRIARSGRRFRIEAATVWNLFAADGRRVGQAAAFAHWQDLPEAGREDGS